MSNIDYLLPVSKSYRAGDTPRSYPESWSGVRCRTSRHAIRAVLACALQVMQLKSRDTVVTVVYRGWKWKNGGPGVEMAKERGERQREREGGWLKVLLPLPTRLDDTGLDCTVLDCTRTCTRLLYWTPSLVPLQCRIIRSLSTEVCRACGASPPSQPTYFRNMTVEHYHLFQHERLHASRTEGLSSIR